jgi:hypothetical protein
MKWEYYVLSSTSDEWSSKSVDGLSRNKALDHFGALGWELVSATVIVFAATSSDDKPASIENF